MTTEEVLSNAVDIVYGNQSDTTPTVLRQYHCAYVQYRAQRQVVELESMYITLLILRNCKCSNGSLATRKFQVMTIPVEKGRRLGGKQVVILMIEGFRRLYSTIQKLYNSSVRPT
jgi:hypothetical protein